MTDRNKEILTRFIQAVWTEGNVDAADDVLAAHYTIHHDPGDPWDGQTLDLAGFKDRVRQSREPFPDQKFDINALIAEGDKVVATWFWSGTHQADFPGFPASGKRITMSGITVYDFDGDRLSGHWQITDRLGVYRQLTGQPATVSTTSFVFSRQGCYSATMLSHSELTAAGTGFGAGRISGPV